MIAPWTAGYQPWPDYVGLYVWYHTCSLVGLTNVVNVKGEIRIFCLTLTADVVRSKTELSVNGQQEMGNTRHCSETVWCLPSPVVQPIIWFSGFGSKLRFHQSRSFIRTFIIKFCSHFVPSKGHARIRTLCRMPAVSRIPTTDFANLEESTVLVRKFFPKLISVLYSLYKLHDHTALGSGKVPEEIDHGLVSVLQNWTAEDERKILTESRRNKIQTRELQNMKQNF